MRGFGILIAALVAILGGAASAQAVQQSGAIVPYHVPTWVTNGVQADGGGTTSPAVNALGLFGGANCPFSVSSQTAPGATAAAHGQLSICQTSTATTLMVNGVNGGPTPSLNFNIGGTVYPFPGPGGGTVVGPSVSIWGDVACWNSTVGTVLKDCGLATAGPYSGPTGQTAGTIGGKLGQTVSVIDPQFGARCDGSTDDTAAINAAITYVNAHGGGTVIVPSGATACMVPTGTISMKPGVILEGQSYGTFALPGSQISCGGTGDCIASISPINSSTNVSNGVRDLNVKCTNGSNTAGAGYDDVGGSFVTIDHLRVTGCGYAAVFDQTEISKIVSLDGESQNAACLWLVNDSEHTAGASGGFTNNDAISDLQCNSASTTKPLVIDDGGLAHAYYHDNFNGGGVSLAMADCLGCTIAGASEFESASLANITFSNLTFGGTTVGSPSGVSIIGNQITPSAGQHAITVVGLGSAVVFGNSFGSSTAATISGGSNVFALSLQGNFIDGGYSNELSGTPTNLYNFDGGPASLTFANVGAAKYLAGGVPFAIGSAPTIASGFGTSPAIFFNANTAAFEIEIGTGGTATFGTMTMPAATTGWSCGATDITTTSSTVFMTKEVGTTSPTSFVLENFNSSGVAAAWAAGDIIRVQCSAF
jgi:hypothetical protein